MGARKSPGSRSAHTCPRRHPSAHARGELERSAEARAPGQCWPAPSPAGGAMDSSSGQHCTFALVATRHPARHKKPVSHSVTFRGHVPQLRGSSEAHPPPGGLPRLSGPHSAGAIPTSPPQGDRPASAYPSPPGPAANASARTTGAPGVPSPRRPHNGRRASARAAPPRSCGTAPAPHPTARGTDAAPHPDSSRPLRCGERNCWRGCGQEPRRPRPHHDGPRPGHPHQADGPRPGRRRHRAREPRRPPRAGRAPARGRLRGTSGTGARGDRGT